MRRRPCPGSVPPARADAPGTVLVETTWRDRILKIKAFRALFNDTGSVIRPAALIFRAKVSSLLQQLRRGQRADLSPAGQAVNVVEHEMDAAVDAAHAGL